ncbi:hypothetical protein GQ42DRAFT_122144 [Ramicandelaber brevisporus]|nr:hypothetical protein GQ42DRAFT_122144 [Ramicandelaber brevisporus]
MSAGLPRARVMATRCNSPPERVLTSWSSSLSMRSGLSTSVLNCGSRKATRILEKKSWWTVPSYVVLIFCGLSDTLSSGISWLPSGFSLPASSLMKVVLPVPFSPNMTMISESVNSPASTLRWKSPWVLVMLGYLNMRMCLTSSSSTEASCRRKTRDSSRKRMFSVGIMPSRNTLMPSRTPYGRVTTPYMDGMP